MKKALKLCYILFFLLLLNSCNTLNDEFEENYNNTFEAIKNSNSYSLYTSTNIYFYDGYEYEETNEYTAKYFQYDPILVISNENGKKTTYRQDGDVVYIGEPNNQTFYSATVNFDIDKYNDFSNNQNLINIKTKNIEEKNGEYIITGTFGELIGNDENINNMFESLDDEMIKLLKNSKSHIIVKLLDKYIMVNIQINIEYLTTYSYIDIMTVLEEGKDFEPTEHHYLPYYKIKNSIKTTDITFESPNVYYTKLTKGQYVLYDSYKYIDYSDQIYYADGFKMENKYTSYPYRTGTFYIPKDGMYYINFSNENNSICTLEKLNSKPYLAEETIVDQGEYQSYLSNKYEFDIYKINAENEGICIINNTSSSYPTITYSENYKSLVENILYDSVYLNFKAGDNYYYVTSDYKNNYSFNVNIFERQYKSTEENLTESPSDQLYISGLGLSDLYLKFDVESDSKYIFSFQNEINNNINIKFELYVKSTMLLKYEVDPNVETSIREGSYYVKIKCDDAVVGRPYYRLIEVL